METKKCGVRKMPQLLVCRKEHAPLSVEIVTGFPEEMFELGSEALCLTSRHASLIGGRNVGHCKEKEHAAGCIR